MKKNDYLLLVATGAYSFLFYKQNAGINFLMFNAVLITLLALKNVKLVKSKKWLWAAAMCLVSAASVFVTSSALSIIANIASLLLLSAYSFNVATSALFSFLFSCYSVISCVVYIIIDWVKRAKPNEEEPANRKGYKVLATLAVLLLSILFFNMYKSSNPLFAENTKWINFDFISLGWVFFTLGGFLLVYAFLYHKVIKPVEAWENKLPLANGQSPEDDPATKRFETERYGGLLLFILLNLMLVVLNMGDVQTLYFSGGLPKNISHSDFVHNGVGITILSIIIATSLIMYLFRKEFSRIKANKALMAFVYLWIIQNIIMLSSTAIRNQIYIHDFNFTYKRIGVYVWLALAAIGLCIMFWKIYQKRSNWYLIRTNVAVWFSVLVISGCFNWDKLITNYNIANKPLKDVDFYYLFSLSDANIPELMAITKTPEFEQLNNNLKNFTHDRYNNYYTQNYRHLLTVKLNHYLSDYSSDWRSFDLRDREIHYSIFHN
jgi:hypothetical protein